MNIIFPYASEASIVNKEVTGSLRLDMKYIAYMLLSIAAVAQNAADSGQITGMVKDPSQAVVSGAEITLTNQKTKAKIAAVSDVQGVYKFPSVLPGVFVVGADVKGFKAGVSPELK